MQNSQKACDKKKKSDAEKTKNNELPTPESTCVLPCFDFPNEILSKILQCVQRKDLENCLLVCKKWSAVIDKYKTSMARREIKKIEIKNNTITNANCIFLATSEKQLQRDFDLQNKLNPNIRDFITMILKHSKVEKFVCNGVEMSETLIQELINIFKDAEVIFHNVALNNVVISAADIFFQLLNQMKAQEFEFFEIGFYHINFGQELFQISSIKEAEIIKIELPSLLPDDENFVFNCDDKSLINFIFCNKNIIVRRKKRLLITHPTISSLFLNTLLMHFQKHQFSSIFETVELLFCCEQIVSSYQEKHIENNDSNASKTYFVENVKSNINMQAIVEEEDETNNFSIILTMKQG